MRKKGDIIFLLAVLSGSLCLNVFLGWELHRSQPRISAIQQSAEEIVGLALTELPVKELSGGTAMVRLAGETQPTVLYVLRPGCSWCDRNMENIKALARNRRDMFRFVGLALNDSQLREYVESHEMNFPVYVLASSQIRSQLRLGFTPQTILISAEGKLERNWIGAYKDKLQNEIESYFGLQLPGLAPE